MVDGLVKREAEGLAGGQGDRLGAGAGCTTNVAAEVVGSQLWNGVNDCCELLG